MVRKKLAHNQSFARRHTMVNTYLLRALVRCGHCLASCGACMLNHRYAYYICTGKAKPVHSHRASPCSSRYIPASQRDILVWQDLCTILQQPASLTQALERVWYLLPLHGVNGIELGPCDQCAAVKTLMNRHASQSQHPGLEELDELFQQWRQRW